MAHVHEMAAIRIVDWLHRAEDSLVGRVVTPFAGEADVVKEIRLDDLHGLCFTFEDPVSSFSEGARRWYPVSTIKDLAQ